MTTRTYCEGCGTYRFKEAAELCFHCQRKPIETETAEAASAAPAFRPESGRNVITSSSTNARHSAFSKLSDV